MALAALIIGTIGLSTSRGGISERQSVVLCLLVNIDPTSAFWSIKVGQSVWSGRSIIVATTTYFCHQCKFPSLPSIFLTETGINWRQIFLIFLEIRSLENSCLWPSLLMLQRPKLHQVSLEGNPSKIMVALSFPHPLISILSIFDIHVRLWWCEQAAAGQSRAELEPSLACIQRSRFKKVKEDHVKRFSVCTQG